MYQQNPLLEMSTRQLIKKRRLYSPEQWQKMMQKLQSLGKDPNAPVTGLHSAEEYGKRMIAGQVKRARKAASKYNRKLKVHSSDRSRTSFRNDGDLIRYKKTAPFNASDKNEEIYYNRLIGSDKNHRLKDSFNRKIIRKKLRDDRLSVPNLIGADTLAHETDEYITALKLADKHNLNPIDIARVVTPVQHKTGNHMPGVLDKEAKRAHTLSTLYGRDSFAMQPRDKFQFAKNKSNYVLNHPLTKRQIRSLKICRNLGVSNPFNKQEILQLLENPEMLKVPNDIKPYIVNDLKWWLKALDRLHT